MSVRNVSGLNSGSQLGTGTQAASSSFSRDLADLKAFQDQAKYENKLLQKQNIKFDTAKEATRRINL